MADPGKCADLVNTTQQTILLAIKLVGDVGQNLDDFLANAIKSEEVQKEIKNALEEIVRNNLNSTPVTFSGEEAKKLATALARRSATAIGQDVLGQVKKSPQYARLRKSAEGILEALKCTPAGVFYDKNKKMIYILGAGVIVAGAVAMYIARSGDQAITPITSLIGDKKLTAKPIGSIEVSAGSFKFVPSKREFQVELGAAGDFDVVKVEFSITGQAIDTDVNVMAAQGKVFIPVGKVVTRLEAGYDPMNARVAPVNLGLGIEFTAQGVRFDLAGRVQFSNNRPTAGSIGLGVIGNYKGVRWNMDLGGKLDNQSAATVFGVVRGEF
jgi:hypothetical protein